MRYFILLLFFITSTAINGQDPCYLVFLEKGKNEYKAFKFENAINSFKAALICNDADDKREAQVWLDKSRNSLLNFTIKSLNTSDSLRQQLSQKNDLLEKELSNKLQQLENILLVLEELKYKYGLSEQVDDMLAINHGNLSWNYILNKRPKDAIIAAHRGLKFNKKMHWIYGNMALAYALNNEFEKVKEIILKHKEKVYKGKTVKRILFDDIQKLGEFGIEIPYKNKILLMLNE